MNVALEKAGVAASKIVSDKLPKAVAFDPLTLLAIAGLIVQVVQAVMKCFDKPTKGLAVVKRPGIVNRIRLNKMVKDFTKKNPNLKDASLDEVLEEIGKSITEQEMASLYVESRIRRDDEDAVHVE